MLLGRWDGQYQILRLMNLEITSKKNLSTFRSKNMIRYVMGQLHNWSCLGWIQVL